jgi:uncharacterized surface protein with fasciclin (FAS1) repeats
MKSMSLASFIQPMELLVMFRNIYGVIASSCALGVLLGGFATTADAHPRDPGRSPTILELLRQTDGSQALVAAIDLGTESGCLSAVAGRLDSSRPDIVVFAPSNSAFERLLRLRTGALRDLDSDTIKSLLPELLTDVELDVFQLCDILGNHVAEARQPNTSSVTRLLREGEITMINGTPLPISVGSGDVAVNYESEISIGDVTARNGIIHFINSVIKDEPPPAEDTVTVFVTFPTYDGNLGGLAGADQICEERATAGNIPGTSWKAWLTDSVDTDASERIPLGEYRLADGTLVASNIDDLTDSNLKAAINLDEYRQTIAGLVWTAAEVDGFGTGNNCNDWTDSSSEQGGCPAEDPNCGSVGSTGAFNGEWTRLNAAPFQCNSFQHLYCFGSSE